MKWLLAVMLLACGQARAATVQVLVTGVRNARGHVLVALCERANFLQPHCPWKAKVPAVLGSVRVVLKNVPAGTYAAQAFHDENDDGRLDRNFLGLPKEGMGFSGNAPMHYGPPRFDAAMFAVGKDGADISFVLKYY